MDVTVDDHLAAPGGGNHIDHFGAVSKMDCIHPIKAGAQHVVVA